MHDLNIIPVTFMYKNNIKRICVGTTTLEAADQ